MGCVGSRGAPWIGPPNAETCCGGYESRCHALGRPWCCVVALAGGRRARAGVFWWWSLCLGVQPDRRRACLRIPWAHITGFGDVGAKRNFVPLPCAGPAPPWFGVGEMGAIPCLACVWVIGLMITCRLCMLAAIRHRLLFCLLLFG